MAISSIHLLQVFLNINEYTDTKIVLLTGIHIAFVVSALMLGYLENMMSKTKKGVGKG